MAELRQMPTTPATAPFQPVEQTMTLRDGAKLFYRTWLPERPAERALVLFHRGHEHSERQRFDCLLPANRWRSKRRPSLRGTAGDTDGPTGNVERRPIWQR